MGDEVRVTKRRLLKTLPLFACFLTGVLFTAILMTTPMTVEGHIRYVLKDWRYDQ